MTSSDLQPVDFLPGVPDWSTVHQPLGELFNPVEVRNQPLGELFNPVEVRNQPLGELFNPVEVRN